MKDRKRLEPINAFEAEEGQLTYATIVPVTKTTDDENSSNSNQPPQPVIYAELAATQPPVVNADNNAWSKITLPCTCLAKRVYHEGEAIVQECGMGEEQRWNVYCD